MWTRPAKRLGGFQGMHYYNFFCFSGTQIICYSHLARLEVKKKTATFPQLYEKLDESALTVMILFIGTESTRRLHVHRHHISFCLAQPNYTKFAKQRKIRNKKCWSVDGNLACFEATDYIDWKTWLTRNFCHSSGRLYSPARYRRLVLPIARGLSRTSPKR